MTPRTLPRIVALVAALAGSFAATSHAQLTLPTGFTDSLVVGGLPLPTGIAFVPDAPGRPARLLFVEQKTARVRQIVDGALSTTDPVGTVPLVNTLGNEQGLLSIAVDPRWPSSPYLYMHYNSTIGRVRLSRFTLSGDLDYTGDGKLTFDPATRYDLLTDIPDGTANHNGGALRFGPDSLLWFSIGEDFQSCLAQDTTSLLGKLLRLEIRDLPDSAGGPPAKSRLVPADNPHAGSPHPNWRLVHSLGLRNPFRFHIDPADGALFVADVGDQRWEEVSRVTEPSNLGWPFWEGDSLHATTCTLPAPVAPLMPIVEVPHPTSRSIISLGVYRRPATATRGFPPDYEGTYFYSDYYGGLVRRLVFDGTSWAHVREPGQPNPWDWAAGGQQVSDALVGPDGALWYVRQAVAFAANTGSIRRIVYTGNPLAAPPASPLAAFAAPLPNPSRGDVALEFTLRSGARVDLAMMDVTGRRVRTLKADALGAGTHRLSWDGRDESGTVVAPGLYWARLIVDRAEHVRRVVRLR